MNFIENQIRVPISQNFCLAKGERNVNTNSHEELHEPWESSVWVDEACVGGIQQGWIRWEGMEKNFRLIVPNLSFSESWVCNSVFQRLKIKAFAISTENPSLKYILKLLNNVTLSCTGWLQKKTFGKVGQVGWRSMKEVTLHQSLRLWLRTAEKPRGHETGKGSKQRQGRQTSAV